MKPKGRKSVSRARKPVTKPLKIKVDLSEWELADWPDKVAELVTVERDKYGLEVRLDLSGPNFEQVARKIATEAIEAFFEDVFPTLTEKGITFGEEDSAIGTIPFSHLGSGPIYTFDAIRAWMKEQLKNFGADDKEGQDLIVAEYRKQGLTPPTFDKWGEQVPSEEPKLKLVKSSG